MFNVKDVNNLNDFPESPTFLIQLRYHGYRHKNLWKTRPNPNQWKITQLLLNQTPRLPKRVRWWWMLPVITTLSLMFTYMIYVLCEGNEYIQRTYYQGFSDAEDSDNLGRIRIISFIFTLFVIGLALYPAKKLGNRWDDSHDIRAHRKTSSLLILKKCLVNDKAIHKHVFFMNIGMDKLIEYRNWLLKYMDYLIIESKKWTTASQPDFWKAIMAMILDAVEYIIQLEISIERQSWSVYPYFQGEPQDFTEILRDLMLGAKQRMVGEFIDPFAHKRILLDDAIPPSSNIGANRATALTTLLLDDFIRKPEQRDALRTLVEAFFSYEWSPDLLTNTLSDTITDEDTSSALANFTVNDLTVLKGLSLDQWKNQGFNVKLYKKIQEINIENSQYQTQQFTILEVRTIKSLLKQNNHRALSAKLVKDSPLMLAKTILAQDVATLQALHPKHQILVFQLLFEPHPAMSLKIDHSEQPEIINKKLKHKKEATKNTIMRQQRGHCLFMHSNFTFKNCQKILWQLLNDFDASTARQIVYTLFSENLEKLIVLFKHNVKLAAEIIAVMMKFPIEPADAATPTSNLSTSEEEEEVILDMDEIITHKKKQKSKKKENNIQQLSETSPLISSSNAVTPYSTTASKVDINDNNTEVNDVIRSQSSTSYSTSTQFENDRIENEQSDSDVISNFIQEMFWNLAPDDRVSILKAMLTLYPLEKTEQFFALTIPRKEFFPFKEISAVVTADENRVKGLVTTIKKIYSNPITQQKEIYKLATQLILGLHLYYSSEKIASPSPYRFWNRRLSKQGQITSAALANFTVKEFQALKNLFVKDLQELQGLFKDPYKGSDKSSKQLFSKIHELKDSNYQKQQFTPSEVEFIQSLLKQNENEENQNYKALSAKLVAKKETEYVINNKTEYEKRLSNVLRAINITNDKELKKTFSESGRLQQFTKDYRISTRLATEAFNRASVALGRYYDQEEITYTSLKEINSTNSRSGASKQTFSPINQ